MALVLRLAQEPDSEDALDLIYFEFDLAFRQGRFDEADVALAATQPRDLVQPVLMLALMSITRVAKDKLPSRAAYVARVSEALADDPRRESLMAGIT